MEMIENPDSYDVDNPLRNSSVPPSPYSTLLNDALTFGAYCCICMHLVQILANQYTCLSNYNYMPLSTAVSVTNPYTSVIVGRGVCCLHDLCTSVYTHVDKYTVSGKS